jgi:hypothetical protein
VRLVFEAEGGGGVWEWHLTYPADCVPVLLGTVRIGDLVVFVVCGYDVLEDGTTFEDLDFAPVRVFVSEGGDATIGIDLEKPGFLLLVLSEVYGYHLDAISLAMRARRVIIATIPCTRDQAPPEQWRL